MTCYLNKVRESPSAAKVSTFSQKNPTFTNTAVHGSGCDIRVTHASIGATDIMARRGDYLLHPFPGFVSGYDCVGVIERSDRHAAGYGLAVGDRVAAVLPNMGAHAERLRIPSSLLVKVPESMPSELAATLPLDAVTARYALDLLGKQPRRIFISGVSGAVGLLAAQLAAHEGVSVYGTASAQSAAIAERYGVRTFDYRDEQWPELLVKELGRLDGVIDHTGSRQVNGIVLEHGRIVRTAFGGKVGHQKAATAAGLARTLARRHCHPREIVCSAPLYVAMQRNSYRHDLALLLNRVAMGKLMPLTPEIFSFNSYDKALQGAEHVAPGKKIVLSMGE
ncbi:zinc-binding alcohol dehydrogenase family protein [Bifidobacterium aquikefiricola]|uniref:Enoyl reductase (ER) domain-containing protein n=1 Tax=Bifidobacterium aquikefiricola TaxID=3059038 RepID=A0AB39U576_9BIFI